MKKLMVAWAVALAGIAFAEDKPTIYAKAGAQDSSGQSSFSTGNGWSNGLPPGPGTNYVWNASGNFRTPERTSGTEITHTFAGDSLTFTSGAIALKTASPTDTPADQMNGVVFPDLTLNKDNLAIAQSSAPNRITRLSGTITLQQNVQFRSSVGAKDEECHYDIYVDAALKGEAARTVFINHYNAIKSPRCPNTVRIAGDNSGYAGKWAVHNFNATNTLEGMVMSVESPTALGSDPEEMVANSIRLYNNGALAIAAGLCAEGPFAPANRGITIEAPGGRLTTISNETWSTAMPIAGDYPLTKGGAGRVVLEGPYSAGAITVEQGALRFGKSFAPTAGMPSVTVLDGAAFELAAPANAEVLADFAIPANTTFITPINVEEGTAETVVLGSGVTMPEGKVRISLDHALDVRAASEVEFPLLTVPASVRTLTADDIENVSPQNAYQLPKVCFAVKDNAEGVQTVYATLRKVVTRNLAATGDNSKWWTSTQKSGDIYLWSDELAAHPGADYLVDGSGSISLRASQAGAQTAKDFDFPGESLTFYNDGILAMKCRRMTFKNLALAPNRQVAASGCGETMQYVAGDVTFLGAFNSTYVNFDGTRTQGITLEARCHGAGTLRMRVYENNNVNDYTNVWAAVTGDNSDFTGKFCLYSKYGNALTNGISCRFNAPENLGGPMAERTCQGIFITSNSALSPTASMTLDTENRGIYTDLGRLDIPEGVTLTVKQPLSLNGSLAKEGKGSLVLATPTYFGMFFSSGPNNNNFLDVREGGVGQTTVDALKSLQTSFRKDGFLIVDPEAEDSLVKTLGVFVRNAEKVGLTIPDDVLNVKVQATDAFLKDRTTFSVPVCTVSPAIAETLRGKIRMMPLKGFAGTVREDVPGDYPDYVRFTLDVAPKGLSIILR